MLIGFGHLFNTRNSERLYAGTQPCGGTQISGFEIGQVGVQSSLPNRGGINSKTKRSALLLQELLQNLTNQTDAKDRHSKNQPRAPSQHRQIPCHAYCLNFAAFKSYERIQAERERVNRTNGGGDEQQASEIPAPP